MCELMAHVMDDSRIGWYWFYTDGMDYTIFYCCQEYGPHACQRV